MDVDIKKKIFQESKRVDEIFEQLDELSIDNHVITFPVPDSHPRYESIKSYDMICGRIEENISARSKILVTDSLENLSFIEILRSKFDVYVLCSDESVTKNKDFIDNISNEFFQERHIVGVGGGVICNIASYLSEDNFCGLTLFPTTLLSMADSNGGKVRLNAIYNGNYYKHFVKSYYEPDKMVLDDRFLETLPQSQIKIGLVEIIKHGLFQSPTLLNYLQENHENVLRGSVYHMKKIAMWSADLKRVCLEIDHEEQDYGTKEILRAGHDISDRLEEQSKFRIPHGLAVGYGILESLDVSKNNEKYQEAKEAFSLFEIPCMPEDILKIIRGHDLTR